MTNLKPLFQSLSAALLLLAINGDSLRQAVWEAHHNAEQPAEDDALKTATAALLAATSAVADAYAALAKVIDDEHAGAADVGSGVPVQAASLRLEASFAPLMSKNWLLSNADGYQDIADGIAADIKAA